MSPEPRTSSDPETACKPDLSHIESSALDLSNTERSALEKKLLWKQDLRIVPLSAGIFLLCYLDRSNIGTLPSTIHAASN